MVLALLRFAPRIVFAVIVQMLGAVLLIFVLSVLFPEQRWVSDSLMLPYLCWSTWLLCKHIDRWSKSVTVTQAMR